MGRLVCPVNIALELVRDERALRGEAGDACFLLWEQINRLANL